MLTTIFLAIMLWQQPEKSAPTLYFPAPTKGENATITFSATILVMKDGRKLAWIEPDGYTYIDPVVSTVCPIPRFCRNLKAASKGSKKAERYLNACARKL